MAGPFTLFLIRHGIAEARSKSWPDDSKRPLTDEGMARLRKEARGLARLDVVVDVILTSPFVRTRQTAEIIASAFEPRPHVTAIEALTPDGSYAAVLAELSKHARRTSIALVGHEPGIGELAARLVGSRHPIPFKKGAVACIEVDALPPAGPGTLQWFLPPKALRRIRN
jgi:phosphohistidine phosphatase